MAATKRLRVPDTPSAIVAAASLALSSISASSRSSTRIRSPLRRLIFDSTGRALYAGAVNTSLGFARSTASSAVISLVVLAIERRSRGSLETITEPSRASMRMAAAASSSFGGDCAPAGAARASAPIRATTTPASLRITRAA